MIRKTTENKSYWEEIAEKESGETNQVSVHESEVVYNYSFTENGMMINRTTTKG